MASIDMALQDTDTSPARTDERGERTLAWLADQFPAWDFALDSTSTPSKGDLELWVARRDGRHPQSALTPGKLHTRLVEFQVRDGRSGPVDDEDPDPVAA